MGQLTFAVEKHEAVLLDTVDSILNILMVLVLPWVMAEEVLSFSFS